MWSGGRWEVSVWHVRVLCAWETPPRELRGLGGDTVTAVVLAEGRRRGACAWGWGVVRVHPHIHRQSYTPLSLKLHACNPTKTHVCIHVSPETGMHAAVFIFASPNTHICTHEHEQMWLCKHTD